LLYLTAGPDVVSGQWGGPQLAVIFLVLGYGGLAGLVPLHPWLADAIAEGTTQGAILIGTLLANVPLLVFLRLRSDIADGPDTPIALFLVVGLATLLLAAFCLATRPDMRRRLTFAGTALIGVVVFAFGLGSSTATFGGLLIMTMVTLVRASAFQCLWAAPTRVGDWTRTASVLGLAGLPILALLPIAGATADYQPWLLLPLGAGVLLTAGSLLGGRPATDAARAAIRPANLLELAPVWLQLGLVVLLAVAMPGPVAGWFRTMATFR
jgi:NADH:ubiquinone oxidoreductase subunit 4 (subunit M)